jgi:hypothetical protein
VRLRVRRAGPAPPPQRPRPPSPAGEGGGTPERRTPAGPVRAPAASLRAAAAVVHPSPAPPRSREGGCSRAPGASTFNAPMTSPAAYRPGARPGLAASSVAAGASAAVGSRQRPKPSSSRTGRHGPALVGVASGGRPIRTSRSSMSTNAPVNGRSEPPGVAAVCISTTQPRPRRAAETSGEPSASAAQTCAPPAPPSRNTASRRTRASAGGVSPASGPATDVPSPCGRAQVSTPSNARGRPASGAGTSSSGRAISASSAKRSSTPPART